MLQFEQRENVKFCQKFGKSISKTLQMVKQAYGEEALGRSAVFTWRKHFAQGRDHFEDDEHTGWPRTVRTELKIQEVATLVRANCFQMVDEITAAAGISRGTCHKILSDDLNVSHVTQHSVPHILTQDQRDDRISIYGDLFDSADKDGTFLNRIITEDKTWCFLYDPQLKHNWPSGNRHHRQE
jgi:hypothetical protein